MSNPPLLAYNPEVDTWEHRIIKICDQDITYEEAYQNEEYVDIALGIKKSKVKITFPIEFTQFVLRKMAINERECSLFCKALHPKAKKYFWTLIGTLTSEKTKVHPCSDDETSTYRASLTKVFCKKVIMNLHNVEDRYFDKFARVFPFVVRRNVTDYKINILNCLDDCFYETIQGFLDQHFDNVEARKVTILFLNNIRDFLEKNEERLSSYFDTFPRLDFQEIRQRQFLHAEYCNVQKHFNIDSSDPHRYYMNEYYNNLPEKNIEEICSLLQSIEFQTKYKTYINNFMKYVFFFLHAIEENPNRVFSIDDIIFRCLLSLKKYKTVGKAIHSINDVASIALLDLLKDGRRSSSSTDRYVINTSALKEIENYITTLVHGKRVQLNVKFDQTDVTGEMSIIVDDTSFNTQYSGNDNNSPRGIRKFFERMVLAVAAGSPDNRPIKHLITYNAFTGYEKKFTIPEDVQKSVKNFIRLSIKSGAIGDDSSCSALSASFKDCMAISKNVST